MSNHEQAEKSISQIEKLYFSIRLFEFLYLRWIYNIVNFSYEVFSYLFL